MYVFLLDFYIYIKIDEGTDIQFNREHLKLFTVGRSIGPTFYRKAKYSTGNCLPPCSLYSKWLRKLCKLLSSGKGKRNLYIIPRWASLSAIRIFLPFLSWGKEANQVNTYYQDNIHIIALIFIYSLRPFGAVFQFVNTGCLYQLSKERFSLMFVQTQLRVDTLLHRSDTS